MTIEKLLAQRSARQGARCLASLPVHLGRVSAGYQHTAAVYGWCADRATRPAGVRG